MKTMTTGRMMGTRRPIVSSAATDLAHAIERMIEAKLDLAIRRASTPKDASHMLYELDEVRADLLEELERLV
jgi:hypothetical protein